MKKNSEEKIQSFIIDAINMGITDGNDIAELAKDKLSQGDDLIRQAEEFKKTRSLYKDVISYLVGNEKVKNNKFIFYSISKPIVAKDICNEIKQQKIFKFVDWSIPLCTTIRELNYRDIIKQSKNVHEWVASTHFEDYCKFIEETSKG